MMEYIDGGAGAVINIPVRLKFLLFTTLTYIYICISIYMYIFIVIYINIYIIKFSENIMYE